ncbi:IS21 family transposase [Thiomicrorhabdus sp. Milos-T2]|uniref:IS21 family transposase n=1 Tax=Thiomicrorhabdus sp. Milos-T2 TaxID=90814 RepID=UPI0004949508|nr:IS21 family transposase [Thiomicrorhabdus sp. Milos-T2]
MAQQKLSPRDVCRIAIDERLSHREVARVANVSATTVNKYRSLMKIHGIKNKDELNKLSNTELEEIIQARYKGASKNFIEPDWDQVYLEYQKRDVTITLLYQEYVEASSDINGATLLSESSFGRRLRKFCQVRGLSMRQTHLPGQEMFVDFSGKHLFLTDPKTGDRKPIEMFVASLGASRMLFATAVKTQKKTDWIEANVRALEYFGGTTAMIIPDNLKSAVTKPGGKGRDPQVNRSYLDFAEHYGTVIVPARPRMPKDKSLAEIGVRIVNMWIIASLRNHVFYSLSDMNMMILSKIDYYNERRTRRLGASRRELFEELEAGCLMPLPPTRHEYTEWRDSVRVPKDYHISHNKDFYSVPHHLVGRTVSYCVTRSTIRVYSEQSSKPAAIHTLGPGIGANITNREHMPEAHKIYASQNVEELLEWASSIDEEIKILFEAIIANKRIPAITAIRQMSKGQKLVKEYGHDRFASACQYANSVGTQTLPSIENILRLNMDLRKSVDESEFIAEPSPHKNIRGSEAYKGIK